MIKFDISDLVTKVNGLAEYAGGFIEVVTQSDTKVAEALAEEAIDEGYDFIDALARMHPQQLHHMYEWNMVGEPAGRLFNFKMLPIGRGKAKIETAILESRVPTLSGQVFQQKAIVMEAGRPITIEPKGKLLVFETPTGTVFTPNPVTVEHPGGVDVAGSFERALTEFGQYFKVSKQNTRVYTQAKNIGKMFKSGLTPRPTRSAGRSAGQRFIMGLKSEY